VEVKDYKVGDKIRSLIKYVDFKPGDTGVVHAVQDYVHATIDGKELHQGVSGIFRANELELVSTKPVEPKYKFKVGDRVKILGNCDAKNLGKIATVKTVGQEGNRYPYRVEYDDKQDSELFAEEDLELYSDEKEPKHKFKVGDRVRCKIHRNTFVVKVIDTNICKPHILYYPNRYDTVCGKVHEYNDGTFHGIAGEDLELVNTELNQSFQENIKSKGEEKMNSTISKLFKSNTLEEAEVVNKFFGNEIGEKKIDAIILKPHAKEILAEAKSLQAEEDEKKRTHTVDVKVK
jgi:hypothetical protein